MVMSRPGLRSLAFVLLAAFLAAAGSPATAQAPADKANEQQKAEAAKKTEAAHLADVARRVKGSAALPECAHLGENAISLLMRNDVDAANRHIYFYDRFGCSGAHLQASFHCALLIGMPARDAKESLEDIIRTCWLDPSAKSATSSAAAPAAAAAPATAGTGAR